MADPTADAIRCPVHGIPDCSPLLNGCSIPNQRVATWQAGTVCPECAQGKTQNCCGDALDEATDSIVPCATAVLLGGDQ